MEGTTPVQWLNCHLVREQSNSTFIDNFPDLCMPLGRETVQDLIHEIYLGLHHITSSMSETAICRYFSQRVILAARNIDVDVINNAVLQMLLGDSKIYSSADSAFNDAGIANNTIPNEYLNTIAVPGMPLHKTILKINCPIILLRNLNPHEGLCNGTRLVVTAMAERVIEAQILAGSHAGKKVFIPRISLDTSMSTGLGFILRRRQHPIRLGFGMSINKAQGQSLDRVGIYLNNPVFAHGQLYVALSRCTDYRNLRILLPPNMNRRTSNIVYREVVE
jgi:ATP-dependent DNA helicase PIF1